MTHEHSSRVITNHDHERRTHERSGPPPTHGSCGLALGAVLAAATPATSGAAAAEPVGGDGMPGTASATAQALRLNPTFASLSLGITVGFSAADYTNRVARAESRALDLGEIGATLAAEGCDGGDPTLPADQQPQPLRTDSRDPKAAQGYSEQETWAPVVTKSVRASSAPDGEARTGAVSLGDGRTVAVDGAGSRARVHVVDGATREARQGRRRGPRPRRGRT